MNKADSNRKTLRTMLESGKTPVVPGAYDPLSAKLVERAGFPAVYVGSYATAAAGFGMADVGLVTMAEMAAHAKKIADAVDIPVIADGENGWNNAANIWRTIRSFEQAGVWHYGVFSGRAWQQQIYPMVKNVILHITERLKRRPHSRRFARTILTAHPISAERRCRRDNA